jgi:hypothetical protein
MRIRVHFNLQAAAKGQPAWVLTDKRSGKVIEYRDSVALANCDLTKIWQGDSSPDHLTGQALTLSGGKRTVHAWIEGDLLTDKPRANGAGIEISYNPKDRPATPFFHTRDGARVSSAALILFAANKRAYAWDIR